jgi:hypothetical protein
MHHSRAPGNRQGRLEARSGRAAKSFQAKMLSHLLDYFLFRKRTLEKRQRYAGEFG